MQASHLVLRSSIAALLSSVVLTVGGGAATVSTFDSFDETIGYGFTLSGSPSVIMSDGPTGNYLRMLTGEENQNNQYSYDMSDFGAYETISAYFDFRILPANDGLADGIGFMLLPTETYGMFGTDARPAPTAEEPNVLGTFGLAIDVYPGLNAVSTHFNGAQTNEFNVPATMGISFRDNEVFNRVQVDIQRVGNASNAVVTLIGDVHGNPTVPIKIMETVLPNMVPYENRAMIQARTGRQTMIADIDNLNISYSNPYLGGLPVVTPNGHLYQDFQSLGTSTYQTAQATGSSATVFRPGPLLMPPDFGSDGEFLRIVHDGVDSLNNRVVFDRPLEGGASNMTERLEFDYRFSTFGSSPADGMGVLFLPTVGSMAVGGVPSSEEANYTNAIGVGFDIYQNGGEVAMPAVSLHYNNSVLEEISLNNPEIVTGLFHHVEILRTPVIGGLNVSVIITPDINGIPGEPMRVFDNYFIPDARNYDHRVQFTARTGGSTANHDIDNIQSSHEGVAKRAYTRAGFEKDNLSDSGFRGYGLGAGPGPHVMVDYFDGPSFIRLIHDGQQSQKNAIAFDQQADSNAVGAQGIKASFDFRMTSQNEGADGFSLMLIPTELYGTTGVGASQLVNAGEEPNAPWVFGVGIDVWDSKPNDRVTLNWNGNVIGLSILDSVNQINLDNGFWHRMELELKPSEFDTLATLILVPDIEFGDGGERLTIFENMLIPGMQFFDYRVEFIGRTGGSDMNVDLDNILVQTVIPEPGSAALLGLGAVLLARRRRKTVG